MKNKGMRFGLAMLLAIAICVSGMITAVSYTHLQLFIRKIIGKQFFAASQRTNPVARPARAHLTAPEGGPTQNLPKGIVANG